MKRLSVVGAIFTSFVLGAAMTAMAQDDHRQQDERKQQDEHKQETAQPPRQQQAQPEERRQEPRNEERRQEPRQDERQTQQQQENQRREMQQQEKQQQRMDKQQEKTDRQQGHEQERREQAQPQQPMQNGQARAAHRGENRRQISEHDFHAHFGREHRFHPGRMQVYEGRPRFTYGGYMFELVEVWPVDWSYDNDDYYIDSFDDQYWLCSYSHPEIRLELIIIG